jgi:hypothetical protein
MLRSVAWIRTDVSGLRIGPIFKGQDVQEEDHILSKNFILKPFMEGKRK